MQSTKKKSVSVKDKLDGNEIDMSMLGLTEIPVKELVILKINYVDIESIDSEIFCFYLLGCCPPWNCFGPFEQSSRFVTSRF